MRKRFFINLLAVLSSVCLALGIAACDGCKDECTNHQTHTVVTQPATCTTDGVEAEVCTLCNEVVRTQPIPSRGHLYMVDESRTTTVSCTEGGVAYFQCTRYGCGETMEQETGAGGHIYLTAEKTVALACQDGVCACGAEKIAETTHVETTVVTAATCQSTGTMATVCTNCETVLYEREIEKLEHRVDESKWVVQTPQKVEGAATCTYITTSVAPCEDCGETQTREMTTEHHYVSTVTTQPTCLTSGVRQSVCVGCGARNDAVAAVTIAGAHTWVNGVCSTCNKGQTVIDAVSSTVTAEQLSNTEIKLQEAGITLDQNVISGLGDVEDKEIVLGAEKYTAETVTGVDQAVLDKLGDAPIYDLTLTVGGENQHQLNGTVTVTVPYTLRTGESKDNITIGYVEGTTVKIMEDAEYWEDESGQGYVTFTTTHFSYYSVSRLTDQEVCEVKYGGHHYAKSYKAPTCVFRGHDWDICTRCGHVSEDSVGYIAALGHDLQVVAEEGATCTSVGKTTSQCTRCEKEYYSFTAATGHSWTKGERVDATCQHAGYYTKSCTTCQVVFREEYAQTAHNDVVEVVAPTCTAEGYTTRTCLDCKRTTRGELVDALGHQWDIETPTCGQGQTCTVCGNAGMPATGEHTMSGSGTCTVCGYGCTHDYKVIDEKKATCTVSGYIKEKCSKCPSERTTILIASGHVYEGNSCTVCGLSNATQVRAFLAGLLKDGYSVKLTDFSMEGVTKYILSDTERVEMTVKLDIAEGYLTYADGKIYAYMQARGTVSEYYERSDVEAILYGDGEYLYVYTSAQDLDDNVTGVSTERIRYAYGATMDSLTYSDGEGENTATSIEEMFEQIMQVPQVDALVNLLLANEDKGYSFLQKMMDAAFVTEKTATGYTITLNVAGLKELNDALYTQTVDQVVDRYFGEGKFAEIKAYVLGLENKTLGELALDMIDYADENGFTADVLFAAVETLAGMPEGMIRSYLQDPQFASVTVSQFVEMLLSSGMGEGDNDVDMGGGTGGNVSGPSYDYDYNYDTMPLSILSEEEAWYFDYAETVNLLFDTLQSVSVYDTFAQFMGEGDIESLKAQLYDMYDGFFTMLSVVFTADKDMAVQSMNVTFCADDFKNGFGQSFVNGDYVTTEEYYTSIHLDALVSFGNVAIPDGTDAVKADFEGRYAVVLDALQVGLQKQPNGMIYDVQYYYDPVLQVLQIDGNGNIQFYELVEREYYESNSEILDLLQGRTPDVADITQWDGVELQYICGDYWGIAFYKADIDTSIYVYVDIVKKEVRTSVYGGVYHDCILYVPENVPEGIVLDPDEVGCGEYYYVYEKCVDCGEVQRVRYYKEHDMVATHALKAGATSCEEGVIVTYTCTTCNTQSYSYETYYHETIEKPFVTIATDHGDIVLEQYACACSEVSWVMIEGLWKDRTNACCFSSDWAYQTEGDSHYQANAVYTYVYSCVETDCAYVLVESYYGNDEYSYKLVNGSGKTVATIEKTMVTSVGDKPCDTVYRTVWKVYDANGTQTAIAYGGKQSYSTHQTTYYDIEGGYYELCSVCDYKYFTQSTYDENGREKTYEWYCYVDGAYQGYSYQTYTYLSGCQVRVHAIYNAPQGMDDSYEEYYTEERHEYQMEYVIEPTCSQAGRYKYVCATCGYDTMEYGYDWWHGYQYDHDWQRNEGGEYAYKCADCGLESDKAESNIVMEDLTNHEDYGMAGYYTIGFRDWRCRWQTYGYEYYVAFEFVDLNDPTQELGFATIDYEFGTVYDESWFESYRPNWYRDTFVQFSVADVLAAAGDLDLSSGNYGLAIHIIPTNAEFSTYRDTFVLTDFAL